MLERINALIPCDVGSINAVDPIRRRVISYDLPPGIYRSCGVQLALEAHITEHPVVARYLLEPQTTVLRISDVLSQRHFAETALYREFYAKLGLSHELTGVLPGGAAGVLMVALERATGDFSERDRDVLALILPHVGEASAEALLAECRRAEADAPAGSARLTERESDVLSLVAGGATNRRIAERLGISARTVQKHLEHVYEKLNVRTRTAAVVTANRTLSSLRL
ncbi:MAG: hypothetical protein KGM44_12675 [bacterium]|nr:hypothetical protein [bacterium]